MFAYIGNSSYICKTLKKEKRSLKVLKIIEWGL